MGDEVTQLRAALTCAEQAASASAANERRLVEAQRISQVGSYDFELATNTNTWSDQLYRIYGREPQSFNATYERFLDMVHPDDRARIIAVHQHALQTLEPYEMEERIVWPDGQVRTLASWGEVVTDAAGNPLRMMGICWDISARKQIEAQLVSQALHDPLTGLPNRALLLDRVSQALSGLHRRPGTLAVLFIDIDRFKVVNDSLGHEAGDDIVTEFGRRLTDAVRPGDTVARFGGDEFVVLCEELTSPAHAAQVAEHLLTEIARPLIIRGSEVVMSASIGIAATGSPATEPGELLRDADAAMYRAKEDGRARWVSFVPEMRAQAVGRLDTEMQLRRALARNELRIHYQPVIDLGSGALVGVEALVRWQHPTRGLVPPADFIPVAEETGLIVPIGEWVLERACRQLRDWHDLYPSLAGLTMAVNLSGVQIRDPDFARRVAAVLEQTGVRHAAVELEITESVLMRDAEDTMRALRELKELGVHLVVDDFGTGYSSLSYLKRFPVDALKIDRSFIDGLGLDTDDSAIVQAVLALASALGMSTVAEGVETRAQLDVLTALGGTRAQGYYFSHALKPEELAPLLAGAALATLPAPRAPQDERRAARR